MEYVEENCQKSFDLGLISEKIRLNCLNLNWDHKI